MSELKLYTWPRGERKSDCFKVTINGESTEVIYNDAGDFAVCSFNGILNIKITIENKIEQIKISPLNYGISSEVNGNSAEFTLTSPHNIVISIPGMKKLFLFANPLEENIPDKNDPKVKYYESGQVYEVGELWLNSDESLYIEGGAVVKGTLRCKDATNITISGRGIFDNSYYKNDKSRPRTFYILNCNNIEINGIILTNPNSWMIHLAGCRNVHINNIKELGTCIGSDGVDVVGSKNIHLESLFIYNNDDCVVMKASGEAQTDVEDVLIEKCIFGNGPARNAMEIGFETRCEYMRNITFRDCDVLCVHGHGAPISIHNGDRALIHNVIFENIRIEHHYDKLFDLRVLTSRWSKDDCHGRVYDVIIRNIDVTRDVFNPGYTVAVIGGIDDEHAVTDVLFENIRFNGTKVNTAEEMDLYMRNTKNIVIK